MKIQLISDSFSARIIKDKGMRQQFNYFHYIIRAGNRIILIDKDNNISRALRKFKSHFPVSLCFKPFGISIRYRMDWDNESGWFYKIGKAPMEIHNNCDYSPSGLICRSVYKTVFPFIHEFHQYRDI